MKSATRQLKPVAVNIDFQPLEIARGLKQQPSFVFLDSASTGSLSDNSSQRGISILASDPEKIIQGNWQNESQSNKPGLDLLRQELLDGKKRAHSFDCGFPTGGAIGYFEYDGNYCFGIYPHMLIFDHLESQWFEVGDQQSKIDWSQVKPSSTNSKEKRLPYEAKFSSSLTRETFCQRVEQAQQYISAGDIYQVNLSQEFTSAWPENTAADNQAAFTLYERLRDMSPAPYAAYLDIQHRQILSSSPELFLRISGREITTRPIKGTRPRFRDPSADERSAYELITSPKEIAELVMITDLERNDLGKICQAGTVKVSELLRLERFEQVFHLVSTVNGQLQDDTAPLDALLSCFPGGSITGAPKIRAMQIIDELESTDRGLYTGAIGIFGFNDESIFNIAIRTAMIEKQQLRFNVGPALSPTPYPNKNTKKPCTKPGGFFKPAEWNPTKQKAADRKLPTALWLVC
ncbi:MAG: aminodeoxychorismate synthase, component I [Verrucomicrobia bacterium]|nr:aminodeoxychorismate synthase, component I [Verrucomicrobiota bacterium]